MYVKCLLLYFLYNVGKNQHPLKEFMLKRECYGFMLFVAKTNLPVKYACELLSISL